MLNKSAVLWDNSGARLVLVAPPAPLSTHPVEWSDTAMAYHNPTLDELFWRNVQKTDGCWIWTGTRASTNPRRAYGSLEYRGQFMQAHRVSYQLAHGVALTRTEHVLHDCDNPSCVNPDHLHLGTPKQNAREAIERGLRVIPTHCPQGHLFDANNTRREKDGRRRCKACDRTRARERYRRANNIEASRFRV